MSSKQTNPNAQDNDDDDGVTPEPPARGLFADVFRESLGEDIDKADLDDGELFRRDGPARKPDHDNGLPDSPESITQSRAPHGKEAAGMSRSIHTDDETEWRSMPMIPPDSLLPTSPFDLRPASSPAAAPMRGIVEPNANFYDFKFTDLARQTDLMTRQADVMDEFLDVLPLNPMKPGGGPTIQKLKPQRPPSKTMILTPEQQAQIIRNPTKATFIPPSISAVEIRIAGWGPSGVCLLRNLPIIYPNRAKIVRENSFPLESLAQVTEQIQIYDKTLGFQVIYQEKPLKAIIQTPNCGEFIVDFWASSSNPDFYLALHPRREVGIQTQTQMSMLLKALKEDGENIANLPLPTPQPFDSKGLERLESYLENSVQVMEAKRAKTTGKPTEVFRRNVLAEVHHALMSESLEQRKFAMSLLLHGTDLKSTMGSFACRVTAVVLAGSSLDQAELEDQNAMDIHKTLIQILQEAEFVGDEDRFHDFTEIPQDSDMTTNTFHSKPLSPRKRPRHYEDFMCEIHNMAMTILVQALEVATCFQQHKDLIQQFVTNYYLANNGAMNAVFERCIFQVNDPLASHSLSKGYLACRALRILAESSTELRKQVESDDRTKLSILGALEVGESSHWLLHRETKVLHNLIYGQM
ncbi:unnamed protein product [Cylindrotheca closterium]|uniref:Uncharacterized protein n=1 Tax=Cylindrotheca closterium TaxID=2856 RepID=A0AAD2CX26_9STRA|nr:unnamed protein product [Cylindrotheca closterium]